MYKFVIDNSTKVYNYDENDNLIDISYCNTQDIKVEYSQGEKRGIN